MAKYTTMVQLVALRLSIRLELSNLGRLPMTKVYVCIPVSHNIQSRKEQKTSSPRRATTRQVSQPVVSPSPASTTGGRNDIT